MNILDEDVFRAQRELLRQKRVPVVQIGHDVGRKSMKDEEIITLLEGMSRPTFFTTDRGFYRRDWCRERYALVWLDTLRSRVAEYTIRLLRHDEFDTKAKRMGSVIRISPTGISVWRLKAKREDHFKWQSK